MSELDPIHPEPSQEASEAPPPASRHSLHRVFFGPDGLRAGWSLLLFVLLVAATGFTLRFAITHLHHVPKTPQSTGQQLLSPRTMAISEMILFAVVLIPSFLMALIERRPFGCYGLRSARMLPDFLAGLFWGFTALSLLVGALFLTHGIALDGILLRGASAFLLASKWGLVFLFVGLFEEFFFRGYLQFTVGRGVSGMVRHFAPNNPHAPLIGFSVSAFLLSICLFIGAHTGNGGENFLGLSIVGMAGAVFAFSLYRTGTLWWAIGMHAAWDWAQSYFYGTPDSGNLAAGHLLASHPLGAKLLSGGADGPEGSVLAIPTLLLLALVIHLTLPKRTYPA